MQIIYQKPNQGSKDIVLEHKKKTLSFFAGGWGEIQNQDLVFNDLNAYWGVLPVGRQDQIWDIYVEVEEILNTVNHFERLHTQLRKKVGELLKLHPYDEMKYHIQNKSLVKYPVNLHTQYGPGAPEGPLTYLRGEYSELLALMMQIRPIVPIWGEYINRSKSELGTHHKDYQAGLLLAESHVPDTPPYKRLLTYIEAWLGDIPPMLAANMSGISTANFPNWLLNVTLVKRLSVTELVTSNLPDEATCVMSKTYNHMRAVFEKTNSFQKGMLYNKSGASSDTGNEEDNTSNIEAIKVRESISEGEIVAIEHSLEQTMTLVHQIDYTVPKEKVQACMAYMATDNLFQMKDFRFWLVSWVLCGHRLTRLPEGLVRRRITSPKALPLLRHEAQVSSIVAAQALLWHWGFVDLAILLTAKPEVIPPTTMVGSTISKLDKDLSAALVDLYPIPRVLKGKKHKRVEAWPNPDAAALKAQAAVHCVAIKEITAFVKHVAPLSWDKSAPKELLSGNTFQARAMFNTVPSDIKNQLAKLILSSKEPEVFTQYFCK